MSTGYWFLLGGLATAEGLPMAPTITILGPAAVNVVQGRTLQLNADVAGEPEPSVVWASDDEQVATVDQNGLVTSVGLGTATITATATNDEGVDSDSTDVTVREAVPAKVGQRMWTSINIGI